VEGMLTPIGTNGIQNISFMPERGSDTKETFNSNDAISIVRSFEISEDTDVATDEEDEPPVTAWLRPVSPDFDQNNHKWVFLYLGKRITVDISETNILQNAILRGYVAIFDLYKVKMSIRSHTTKSGQQRFDYKIDEVLDFVPAETQGILPFTESAGRDGE
jgi:hypothetical protein